MAGRLKDKGIKDELGPFKQRILRQAALKRISRRDADILTEMINEIESYVMKMDEKPNKHAKERQLW